MGNVTIPASGPIYLDTSSVIYSVEKIEPFATLLHPIWYTAQTGKVTILGSELLLLETLVRPIQMGDNILKTSFRNLLLKSREYLLVPISIPIIELAIRLHAWEKLKTPDAIHAATAILYDCTLFLTNDPIFRRVKGLNVEVLNEISQ